MKKILSFISVLVLALLLVACGGDRGGQIDGKIVEWYELSEDADYNGEAVTINFWHRMGDANSAMITKWVEEFNEIYPNITVNVHKAATDYDALANAISLNITTGNYPDIAESYPDHIARYAQSPDTLLALNNFIDHPTLGLTQEQQDDFLTGLWAEGVSYDDEGTRLSLPFSKSTEALFYNATYFEEHGYEVPATWDEVFEIAEDIKSREPEAIPFGYDSSDNMFITLSEQWQAPYTGYNAETGLPEVQFNNDKSKEMIKFYKEKVDEGLLLTRALNAGAFTSDIFKTGEKLYMYVGSTGGTRYAYEGVSNDLFNNYMDKGFRVGVAPVPAKDENHRRQIQQGPNINLFNHGDEQRAIAAWLFAKFMIQPEKSAEYAIPSGYAPTTQSAYETDLWKEHVANNVVEDPQNLTQATNKLVVEAIQIFSEYEDSFFTSTVFNLSSRTRGEVGNLLNLIFEYEGNNLDAYIDEQYQSSYNYIVN